MAGSSDGFWAGLPARAPSRRADPSRAKPADRPGARSATLDGEHDEMDSWPSHHGARHEADGSQRRCQGFAARPSAPARALDTENDQLSYESKQARPFQPLTLQESQKMQATTIAVDLGKNVFEIAVAD